MAAPPDIYEALKLQIAEAALAWMRAAMLANGDSRTLRNALRIEGRPGGRLAVHVPHYWARFHHDGRGAPFKKQPPGKYFVWFYNRQDDPRLKAFGGQTPERVAQLQHLSGEDFKYYMQRRMIFVRGGFQARLGHEPSRGGDDEPLGMPPKIIHSPTAGTFFMLNERGMRGFPSESRRISRVYLTGEVRRVLPELFKQETL